MSHMLDWSGHCAVVTGGASGLGAATAARLVNDGMKVAVFDLDPKTGQAQADDIGAQFVAVGIDIGLLASTARGLAAKWRR